MKNFTLKLSTLLIIFSLPVFAQDLTVADNGELYVSPTAFVYVSSNVTIAANGDLILDSVSNDFSDFYVAGTSTGNAEYRHFTASVATRDLVSPPVSGQTFSAFATANNGKIQAGTITPGNLLYGPLDNATYVEYDAADAVVLARAKGYRAAATNGGQTLAYTGQVITTDVPITISYGSGQFRQSNLVGNPFTTHIEAGEIVNALGSSDAINEFYAAIYGYDGSATTDGSIWKVINSVLFTELITPGQGFIVVSDTDGGMVTFPESARRVSTTAQDNFITGRQVTNTPSSFKLQLTHGANVYDTSIYFIDRNGTRGLDVTYDAGSLGSSSIGTHLVENAQGINLAIQVLSTADLTATDYVIPIEVNLAAGQQATISIEDLNAPAGTKFYLDDRELNIQTLLTSESYTFTTTSPLSGIGRFYLGTSSSTLSTPSTALNSVEVFSVASSKKLAVHGQLFNDSVLSLYDIRGRHIDTYQLDASQTKHVLDVSHISSGVYLVNLNNNSQSKTTKLVIN